MGAGQYVVEDDCRVLEFSETPASPRYQHIIKTIRTDSKTWVKVPGPKRGLQKPFLQSLATFFPPLRSDGEGRKVSRGGQDGIA